MNEEENKNHTTEAHIIINVKRNRLFIKGLKMTSNPGIQWYGLNLIYEKYILFSIELIFFVLVTLDCYIEVVKSWKMLEMSVFSQKHKLCLVSAQKNELILLWNPSNPDVMFLLNARSLQRQFHWPCFLIYDNTKKNQ